jgi:hypothetical protein
MNKSNQKGLTGRADFARKTAQNRLFGNRID